MRALCLKIAAASVLCVQAAQAEVSINANQTRNMVCSDGVCAPTAKKAYLNVKDLEKLLKSSDIKVTTGAGAKTMGVDVPLTWTSAHRLTLDAIYRVEIKAPVTVAGTGALTIVYNDGGTSGDLLFVNNAKIDFWDLGSSLVINGQAYTLVGSVPDLSADAAKNPDGFYALANDYDAKADGIYKHAPVKDFGGVFEGLGHVIENFSLHAGGGGLFRAANFQATLRDVILADADVVCANKYATTGILAGGNYGRIVDAAVSGRIEGDSSGKHGLGSVGGLVGLNVGVVSRSSADVTVIASDHSAVGGLVGYSANGATIVDSHSGGAITAGSRVWAGGLAGQSYSISRSYSTATVSAGARAQAGGLSGLGGDIDQSFAAGAVIAGSSSLVGGLAGSGHDVTNSYALGSATSGKDSSVGGLAGVGGSISNAYSAGLVHGDSGTAAGGFIGSDDVAGDLALAYWDLDTSGIDDPGQGAGNIANDPGITGLTDVQLKSGLPAGFDPAVWGQSASINNGYPYLLANPPPQ
jgi:hypothetical protein